MRQVVLLLLCVFGGPGAWGAADSLRISPTVQWPGYPAAAPLDSYATEQALYVTGGGVLYAFGPEPGERGAPQVLELSTVMPRRLFGMPGNRLVLGGWRGFAVLDLTNPRVPVAWAHPLGQGQVAGVEGSIVYYTRHDTFELEAWDAANPQGPVRVAAFKAEYWDGTVAGSLAYGVNRLTREFLVWDLSDRTAREPRVLGRAPAEVAARRVHLHNQAAYVLSSNLEEGVEVFDISKPAEPKPLGKIRQEGVYDMAFEGTTAWMSIAQGGIAKVSLVDLFAPPAPMAPLGVFPESIRLFGDKLYAADESLVDLRVFDASSGALDESIVTGETVEFVHAEGGSLATAGRAGVRTFSVRGSGTLVPLGFLRVEERIWMSVRRGDHLFLNAGPGLIVVDMANPASPREVFRGPAGAATNGWTWWYSARIEGSRLHYSNMEGLTVLDISNPAEPSVISQGPGRSLSMFQAGDYIYYGRPNAGFDVVHAADPHAAPLRQVPLFASEYLFARSGDLLIVSVNHISGSSSGELVFYDISDPSNPALIGYGPSFQPVQSMMAEDDRLFVLTYSRLRIFDLSEVPRAAGPEPVNVPVPLLAYQYDFERGFMLGAMSGNALFVAEGQHGLSLWQVEPLVKIHASPGEDGKIRLWFNGPGPGFELLRAARPEGPWQAAEVTTKSTFDIFAAGAAGYFQVRVVR